MRPTPDIIAQAAHWAAQLATDEATQDDRDACEAWCRQDPLHRLAVERMRGLDAQFDSTDRIGREAIETLLEKPSRTGRRFGGLAAGLLLLVGGGWLAAQSLTVRGWFPDYATARGEQRKVTLADGSGLTIDTDTALDLRRSDTERTVTLFHGQVLARVTKDKERPFVVATRDGTATAHGTAFIVRREQDATIVTVIESRVSVCLAKTADCADLLPGDRVRMDHGRLTHLAHIEPETAASWAEGWLAADDVPVAQVLGDLNRYRRQPVRFDENALAGIRVSGSFPLNDTDRALDGIAQSTGLHVSRGGDGVLRISRAP